MKDVLLGDLRDGKSGRFGIVAVTGGAQGIGCALCEAFAGDGATKVLVLDKNAALADAVAQSVGGRAFAVDVTDAAPLGPFWSRSRSRKVRSARSARMREWPGGSVVRPTMPRLRQTTSGGNRGKSTFWLTSGPRASCCRA